MCCLEYGNDVGSVATTKERNCLILASAFRECSIWSLDVTMGLPSHSMEVAILTD